MEHKIFTDPEGQKGMVRVLTSHPREKWFGHWRRGLKYPLYSVVENNGSIFVSLTGEKKEEPYVIYKSDTDTFVANDGWELRQMSEDSRLTALGGGSAIPIPGADAGFGEVTARFMNEDADPEIRVTTSGPNSRKDIRFDFYGLITKYTDKLVNYFKKSETYSKEQIDDIVEDLVITGGGYPKPADGIPKSDLDASVQASLGKADTAVQPEAGKGLFSGSYNDLTDKPDLSDENTFVAVYGTTTYSEIRTASSDGKAVLAMRGPSVYGYRGTDDDDRRVFSMIDPEGIVRIIFVDDTDTWGSTSLSLQETLVSGTNIKTVNNESLLGSGNITAGDPNAVKYTSQTLTSEQKTQARTNIGAGTSSFSGSYNDLSDKPVIPSVPTISTNISTDAASDAKTASPKAVKTYVDGIASDLSDDIDNLETSIQTLGNGAFVVAWDGASTPVAADIPAGVSVTYNTTTYSGSLAASASTLGKVYLVYAGTSGNYDRYVTVGSSTYSWVNLGTTEITLSDYATSAELSQLEAKVEGLDAVIVDEAGLFVVDIDLNIGAKVDEYGVHAKNIIEYEIID